MNPAPSIFRVSMAVVMACLAQAGAQTYFDDIGWTELHALLGGATPDGAGVVASVIEAGGSQYQINSADSQFSGKNISYLTANGTTSAHATTFVGYNFFGNTASIAPGITTIQNQGTNDWLFNALNYSNFTVAPSAVTADVQNHSWVTVDPQPSEAVSTQILRRFDYAISSSDYVAVVGLDNGVKPVPHLLAHSYNAIVVGISNGNHSYGLTTIDGVGRSRPDIVAPKGTTSEATAAVSAAAAVLIDAAGGSATNGGHAVVVKSVLMAGASRTNETEFTWTANRDNGVNSVTGAGELDILRSYQIMAAGEMAPNIDLGESGMLGWDYGAVSSSTTRTYYFQIPEGGMYDYGIVLTWMRVVQASGGINWNSPTSTLANLGLSFYHASGTTLGSLIASGYDDSRDLSASGDVSNVEMLAFSFLAAGDYAIQITSSSGTSTNYGVAWGGDIVNGGVIPEPGTGALLGVSAFGFFVLRLRRKLRPSSEEKNP